MFPRSTATKLQLHNSTMSFSTPPVRQPADTALPHSTSAPIPIPNSLVATSDGLSQDLLPPTRPVSPISPITMAAPCIRLRSLTNLTNFAYNNRGALIAATSCCIGVAALIEDPSCLPQLQELGAGLQGAVYAGGVVCLMLALEWVDEQFEG